MSDFERGRALFEKGKVSAHYVYSRLVECSPTFLRAYVKGVPIFAPLLDFSVDDWSGPLDYSDGEKAARRTRKELSEASPAFRAGFEAMVDEMKDARDFERKEAADRREVERRAADMVIDLRAGATPRTAQQDRLEIARISAEERARDFRARVARHVQAMRGAAAEFVIVPDNAPSHAEFARMAPALAKKDADWPKLEYRNAYGVPDGE